MLPPQLLTSLQTLYNATQPANTSRLASDKAPFNFTIGQQLPATILSNEGRGMFRVAVAGQTIQMQLPGNPQQNSQIQLSVVSINPKVTFSLLASQTPIATAEQIGATARLLANLSNQPLEQLNSKVLSQHPVWNSSQSPDSKEMANALRTTLMNSGLFYESHQAQWLKGERSISQLLLEPQNRFNKNRLVNNTIEAAKNAHNNSPIAKDLLPLVQQQLHTLESNQLVWHGQVWNEQNMRWEVHKDESQTPEHNEHQWSTEMMLDLPTLGDIHAKLNLRADGLSIQLSAHNAETVNKFTNALPKLHQALSEAGIKISNTSVKQHE